ncbi:alkaline phosphatase [Streptomyces sp. NPDC097704]|uniref:alkaline phosphatase n=1 Tax=Streptomyces sp. NPDC097704 TaxID=3157101 RepID=UPI00332F3A4A
MRAFDSAQAARAAVKGGQAKNVILLIGDGMGDSEITLARDYTVGADGRLNMDGFPLTGAYTTYAVHQDGTPDYVTDSAAGGTGWATGVKTVNGRISKTPGTDEAVPTLLELAQRRGYATGSVTTAELTDATPPGLSSTLVTDEGQPLKVNYSTNTPGQSQEHTGTQVRIAAQGPQAYRVLGVTDQTDLFTTLSEALRLR